MFRHNTFLIAACLGAPSVVKIFSNQCSSICDRVLVCLKVVDILPFALLVRVTSRWRWVCSIVEHLFCCHCVHLTSHMGLCGERLEITCVRIGKIKWNLKIIYSAVLKFSPCRTVDTISVIKTSHLMLYREIIAVCSEIHTKHINALCGQKVELLNVKLVVQIVTTGIWRVNIHYT
jgi:hypothetical protein